MEPPISQPLSRRDSLPFFKRAMEPGFIYTCIQEMVLFEEFRGHRPSADVLLRQRGLM